MLTHIDRSSVQLGKKAHTRNPYSRKKRSRDRQGPQGKKIRRSVHVTGSTDRYTYEKENDRIKQRLVQLQATAGTKKKCLCHNKKNNTRVWRINVLNQSITK